MVRGWMDDGGLGQIGWRNDGLMDEGSIGECVDGCMIHYMNRWMDGQIVGW